QTTVASSPAKKKVKNLLKDSGLPALDWWDHAANDPAWWDTVTVKALREATWSCPECDLQFTARIRDMTDRPTCPECSERRRAQWEAELAQWKVTPVAAVPKL